MKALFICGSVNQTRMMHKISKYLTNFQVFFTPYYCDKFGKLCMKSGLLDFCVMGGKFLKNTFEYLERNSLEIDHEGRKGPYDLVLTCSDLIVPKNVRNTKLVLVQEGMTDPETLLFYIVKYLRLPRWIASTSTTGLSNLYDIFCVASEGYSDLFKKKGVKPAKIRVTGIPNFDNCVSFNKNDFPYKDYVLAATSDRREIYRYENRKKFIEQANKLAKSKKLIFKFHPNENISRATEEVERYSPEALIYSDANTDHLIANCSTLITGFSSVAFVGVALGKEVFSDYSYDHLVSLLPIQNGGRSAYNIAQECKQLFPCP